MTKAKMSLIINTTVSIILLILSLFIWLHFNNPANNLFGFQVTPLIENIANKLITFSSVIAGVVIGALYRHLTALQKVHQEKISWGELFKAVTQSVDFKIALIAAPIVFLMIINTTNGMKLSGLVLFGLEHGFISPIIIKKFVNSRKDAENE